MRALIGEGSHSVRVREGPGEGRHMVAIILNMQYIAFSQKNLPDVLVTWRNGKRGCGPILVREGQAQ